MKCKLTVSLVSGLEIKPERYEVWDSEIKGFMLRVSPTGEMSYYLAYRHNGRKRRLFIGKHGTITATQARKVAKKKAGEVANGVDIQEQKQEKRKETKRLSEEHTLESFIDGPYKDWREANRKRAEDTIRRLKSKFCVDYGKLKLYEITAWNIEKWKNLQLKNGNKPATVNRDLAELKAALNKAVEWEVIEVSPLARVKQAKLDRNPNVRYLSPEEEQRLRAALVERDEEFKAGRASANEWRRVRGYAPMPDISGHTYGDHITPMVLLSLNTGMRRGEVFHLTWGNVDFSGKTLTVVGDKSKNGQTRHVPMNQEALGVLRLWQEQGEESQQGNDDLVFPGKEGAPLDNVKKAWTGLLKRAEITGFRWHDLRHDFASKLVMADVALNTVRELLGHADLKTTLRYAHLAPSHKTAAVERLSANKVVDIQSAKS
jgi:integrase